MSYILKALARSEQARIDRRGPNLDAVFDAPPVEGARGRGTGWVVAGLLVVLAVVGGGLLWSNGQEPGHAPVPARDIVAHGDGAPVAAPVVDRAQPSSQGAPVASLLLQAGSNPPSFTRRGPPAPLADRSEVKPEVKPAQAAPLLPPVAPPQTSLPSLPMPVQRTSAIPGLDVLVHFYAQSARQRFVVIDNDKYREGEKLDRHGATLLEITRDGIILDMPDGRVHLVLNSP